MKNIYKTSLIKALESLKFPIVEFSLQVPKNKNHGDLATNVAFLLSKKINKNPIEIAENIKSELDKTDNFSLVSVAKPGFINLKLNSNTLVSELNKIIKTDVEYGASKFGKGKTVLLEFVSANPTGPLTVGHGRGAIIGDCLANILKWNGYKVSREYYYNNAGRQMRVLAESVSARYKEILGEKVTFPEDGYQGEYIKDIAQHIITKDGSSIKDTDYFKSSAEKYIFKDIDNTLNNIGIKFDSHFNENTLYENKDIYKVLERLKKKDLIYEKEGAVWFHGTKVGRGADRVLIKSSGEPTYRLPDIAYHITKFERNFDLIIDIFGADHMDAYPDVLESLNQLDYNIEKIKVLIHQFVTIIKNDSPVKMSTRKANFITLNKLIDEVGKDAVRYFFIMRGMNSHLNFDLDIAKAKSEKNPVYYIQYAHARISTILKKIDRKSLNKTNLNILDTDKDIALIYKLLDFENIILKLAESLEPQILANYLHDLASQFHKYYAANKILTNNKELYKARIVLIKATKIVIRNGLNILGISAPEKM